MNAKVAKMMFEPGENLTRAREVFGMINSVVYQRDVVDAPILMACIEEDYSGVPQKGCKRPPAEAEKRFDTDRWPQNYFGSAMLYAVRATDCFGRLTEEQYIDWWRDALIKYPIGVQRGMNDASNIASWPALPSPMPPLGSTIASPLIVGNLHDAQTSYDTAQDMRRNFPDGSLVTWQGYGHATLRPSNADDIWNAMQDPNAEYTAGMGLLMCVDLIVQYFDTGELPPDGHVCKAPGHVKLGYDAAKELIDQGKTITGVQCNAGFLPCADSCCPAPS